MRWTHKELWLSANGRLSMCSRLAGNCGYAGMGDLECTEDYDIFSSHTDFQLQFE